MDWYVGVLIVLGALLFMYLLSKLKDKDDSVRRPVYGDGGERPNNPYERVREQESNIPPLPLQPDDEDKEDGSSS